ncbi:hypothetical protein [Caenibius tardaugens]|uniref:hypothetical protein n=1 Tax=Caenibius tardaugens TaxID=169176 RepID=UPI001FD1F8AA
MADASTFVAHARSDREDCLIDASEPIARLQLRCGGDMPGTIAIAPLLELVRKSRRDGRKLSQTIHVQDGEEHVSAWVEVTPYRDTADGCDILVSNWKSHAVKGDNLADMAGRRAVIDRQIAEFSARLDPLQRVLVWHCTAPDLESLTERIECGKGRPWTDFVTIAGNGHHQPLHWRLLDGALLSIDGSTRQWRATLLPLGNLNRAVRVSSFISSPENRCFSRCSRAPTDGHTHPMRLSVVTSRLFCGSPYPASWPMPKPFAPGSPGHWLRNMVAMLPISLLLANTSSDSSMISPIWKWSKPMISALRPIGLIWRMSLAVRRGY